MANPFDQFDNTPQTGPVYGLPRQAPMQTPDQAVGQSLQNAHTQLENQTIPLQQANTRTSIASTENQIRNTNLDNVNNLRKQFETEQSTQDYKTVLPLMDNAFKLGPNKAGDLNLVYAFGKAMDPNSVVREGEQVMATNVGGVSEKVKGYIAQIEGRGGLTDIQRNQLTEEIRHRAGSLQQTYNQRRAFYEDFAKRSGINPNDVVGPHPGQPFINDEKSYIQSHGGTPNDGSAPTVVAGQTQAGFDQHQDPRASALSPDQTAAYDAWWKANPNPTPEQLRTFGQSINVPITNAEDIIAGKRRTGSISHDLQYKPDIADARGQGGIGEKIDAGIRGAADTASFGLADKVAAATDTLTGSDTFGHNLARQDAISNYDTQNHFPSRVAGQVVGGFAMPLGEMSSLPQIALKSGAAGAAYGAGSSHSLSDVPQNALMGFAGGAALGGALGGAGKGISALRGRQADIPPLVDPATGELNQPMDAMRPADRVQAMKGYGLQTVTPGMAGGRTARVLEQGLNNVPGSAGVMEDVNGVAGKELRRSMQGEAQKFGSSKTLNEGGSELQRGAKEWMTRFDATTSKAYDAIPISPQAPTNLNNTKGTLEQLAGKLESNPDLAQEIKDPTLLKYLDAINKHGLNWQDLKDFRTFVGNKIGQFRFSEDARTGDYRALYGALSEDMRNSAAAQGPGALRAFERANSLKANGERVIEDSLVRILGPDSRGSPEKAAAAVQAMTRGGKGTGDLAKLAQVRAATVKSGAWDEVASTMIHLGGQPANSEGRAFSPQTFVQWYSDMSEPARSMLFKPELRKSLDGFVAMNQQLARVKGLTNTSNTTPTMIGSGVIGATGMLAVAHPAALAIPILGGTVNYGMAKLWTTPKFVSLITGYGRAVASGNQNAVKSQIGRLGKLAATNPELRQPLIALQQKLLSGANDNAMMGAVASQPNTEEN